MNTRLIKVAVGTALLLFAVLLPAFADVAHDGTANVCAVAHFANPITLAAKTTSGSNRVAIIHVGWQADTGIGITSVTYGGSSTGITLVSTVTNTTGVGDVSSSIYRLVAPPTASSSVVITFGDDVRGGACVTSFNGVDQTTPIRTNSNDTAQGDGSTPSLTIDPSAAGDIAVDVAFGDMAAPTAGGGQTQVFSSLTTAGSDYAIGVSYKAGAATVTLTWNQTGEWAQAGASLQAAGGAARNRIWQQ